MLKDMTSRALCGDLALVNAGDGEIVSKEVGKEERGTGGCVDRRSDHATAVDVEINPQRHRLSRSQTNFAWLHVLLHADHYQHHNLTPHPRVILGLFCGKFNEIDA